MKKKIIYFLGLFVITAMISPGSGKDVSGKDEISRLLDTFHKAASLADEQGYLNCLAEDAMFLGTDGSEIWAKDEFSKFVNPYFSKGTGWTYIPKNRVVNISNDGRLAWFREKLFNDKYGELRGSGVLRKNQKGWRIVQYNMVFVIPNGCAKEVVKIIKEYKKRN